MQGWQKLQVGSIHGLSRQELMQPFAGIRKQQEESGTLSSLMPSIALIQEVCKPALQRTFLAHGFCPKCMQSIASPTWSMNCCLSLPILDLPQVAARQYNEF